MVSADPLLIEHGTPEDSFLRTYLHYSGVFDNHYMASIPYILEESCRLGASVVTLLTETAMARSRKATMLTIETSEGTFARSVVSQSPELIETLSTSSTQINYKTFEGNHPAGCRYLVGPFFSLTRERFRSDPYLAPFRGGFDIIIEDTAFQMYGQDRARQVGFLARNLLPSGILICIEKCLHINESEYIRREVQKDNLFKSKYFSEREIERKQEILRIMKCGQVHLDTLVAALRAHFSSCHLTWNSGNFYTIAASNDKNVLSDFVARLGPARIPPEFIYETQRELF